MKTRAFAEREAARHPECVPTFTEGMKSVFRQWTALELALHHQWGGPEAGPGRIASLADEVLSMFVGPEIIYKDDVALVLEDFMETHFNTLLEDGSSEEIGELLCTMWRACSVGDFAMSSEIRRKEALRPQILQLSRGLDSGGDAILQGDDDDDDDDGGEGGDSQCIPNAVFQQAVAQQLRRIREEEDVAEEGEEGEEGGMRGQAGAAKEAEEEMAVDPDGFMLVQTGKARKKSASGKR